MSGTYVRKMLRANLIALILLEETDTASSRTLWYRYTLLYTHYQYDGTDLPCCMADIIMMFYVDYIRQYHRACNFYTLLYTRTCTHLITILCSFNCRWISKKCEIKSVLTERHLDHGNRAFYPLHAGSKEWKILATLR